MDQDMCMSCRMADEYGACKPYDMAGQFFRRRRMWAVGERCPFMPPVATLRRGKVRVGQQKQKKVR